MSRRKGTTPRKHSELPVMTGLPDPNMCMSDEKARLCAAANAEIVNMPVPKDTKGKRGEYKTYTSELRLQIGKYGAMHGATKAARYFSSELGQTINESTVRGMIKAYHKELMCKSTEEIKTLPTGKRGRPLMLGDQLDDAVIEHLQSIKKEGGVINPTVVMATARGMTKELNSGLLAEHGGSISITKSWAKSLLNRLGWVKRKEPHQQQGEVSASVEAAREEFLQNVRDKVQQHSIHPSMTVSCNEIGLNVVPVSNWTLYTEGSEQASVVEIDDKRQITMVLASTPTGTLLPPQVIYQGKTDQVHPHFTFPDSWDIRHTTNHRGTEETHTAFLENILVPYFTAQRQALQLKDDHAAMVILDNSVSEVTKTVQDLYASKNVVVLFIPTSYIRELQPLDISCNNELKNYLKEYFSLWYAGEVTEQIRSGESVKINLQLAHIKPLHAHWMLQAWYRLSALKETITLGWEIAGLSRAINTEDTALAVTGC